MNRITAVVAGLSLAFVGTSTTIAATINVPGDQPSIAAAISASSNGDVINIAAGTYNEYNLNPGGKAITIQGTLNGNGSLATTIDAQQGGSVFVFDSGETSGTEIKALVITWGTGTYDENGWHKRGGGIYCYYSSPTITNCTIKGNTAYYGGGITCDYYSNPTINGCTIEDNTPNFGGGIYCSDSNPTITNCTIVRNTTYGGGGIYCYYSSPTISGSLFCGNEPDNIEGSYNNGGANILLNECPSCSGCGACCINGTCITASEPDCIAAGGSYAGDDVACADAGCATPGACCVPTGCVTNSNDDCTALGGTWLGEGGSCDDCPATCAGDTNGDGAIDIYDLLNMLSHWGACP